MSHTLWSGCDDDVNMELYVVEANRPTAVFDKKGGRHVYEVIWDFFERSGRP